MKKILLFLLITTHPASYSMWIEFGQGFRTYSEPGDVCVFNDTKNSYQTNISIDKFLEKYTINNKRAQKFLNDKNAIFIYYSDQRILEIYKKKNALLRLIGFLSLSDKGIKQYYKTYSVKL